MKFLLFGTGDYYKRYRKWFKRQEVLALLDNFEGKQYQTIDGIKVLPPEQGIKLDYDAVVILSFFVEEMRVQLCKLGVPENKIFHFYDLHHLLGRELDKKAIQYYSGEEHVISARIVKNRILLMSQDLEMTGPSIALFYAAKFLQDQGFEVIYVSMVDGSLRDKLVDNNIPLAVDNNLQVVTMRESVWSEGADLIICNTINFHIFLMDRNMDIPVVWWLHDPEFFYAGVRRENLMEINFSNITVCSVGMYPKKAIHHYLPNLLVDELLYGVEDRGVSQDERTGTYAQVCFTTIGYINSIKGQDILLNAIKCIPDKIRKNCLFRFVGKNNSPMARKILCEAADMQEIEIIGTVGREEIHKILSHTDILICPSREDAMPTVCAEAMMHAVPCLVSDTVGTAEYIKDGENGLTFCCADVQMLVEKIIWCVANKDLLADMGKKARVLYEKVFSMPTFEKKLMSTIERALENKGELHRVFKV